MQLAPDFHFNQGNLQDFFDCRRRFYLRHIRQLAWPALQTEPALENELHIRRGAEFHRLVQQHLLGVPAERLHEMIADEQLAQWWDNYITHLNLTDLGDISGLYPEITLSAPLAGYRLVAKYDLVVMTSDGRAIIYDWKTSLKRPKSQWLEKRQQTRLYPYLLVQAGSQLNQGKAITAEQVSMRYWFAGFPELPEHIPYHTVQYHEDEKYLSSAIKTILSLDENGFPLTEDERHCRFCVYRSLCDRGERAGLLGEMQAGEELEDDFSFNLDFEQIGEIQF
jgi:CRISPR/Cas system-associated exonuclease Cas4 (RecB family)